MVSSAGSDLSPPPLKRRRRESPVRALANTLPSRPITDLQDDQLRIFTWNVNGIAPFLQLSITSFFKASKKGRSNMEDSDSDIERSSPNLRECLKRWKWPQVLCLQEVKISPRDGKTQETVRKAVKAPASSDEPSYVAYFSLPRDKFNARGFGGKVYGVCTIVRSDLLDQQSTDTQPITTSAVDWDLEGRIVALSLPKRSVLVLNVYAVNGTDNPYRSPSSGQVTGTRHDHKRVFHTRLRDMVSDYENRGWSVVIAGDLNIARGPVDGFPGIRLASPHVVNRQDFEEKFMKSTRAGGLEMEDSFRYLHGDEKKYTYRSPNVPWGASCDRVDLILVTSNMVHEPQALLEADILDSEPERGPSDHLPSYVTLDLNRLRRRIGV